ncbi:CASP-like protein 3A1 isoform X3 [Carica papaya]|uniref:CASP-like protein 3A1 isoform X3 n=1 Tax=Carica papaya TaxID=3649 RepID=UPI000B8CAAD2|nr:CASP-like protein 3A1 isoform X3 [Carica papaya]
MMVNGQKTEPLSLEVAETKVAAAAAAEEEEKVGRRTHMAVAPRLDPRLSSRRADLVRVALRLMCMAASVTAMSFMLTARQVSAASFYGFQLHLYSKWSFSYAFACCYRLLLAAITYLRVKANENVSSYSFTKSSMVQFCCRSDLCMCDDKCRISCIWSYKPESDGNQTYCSTKFLQGFG